MLNVEIIIKINQILEIIIFYNSYLILKEKY